VSFEVESGEWIAIMGRRAPARRHSSISLEVSNILLQGASWWMALEIGQLGEHELTRYRSDKIGFDFQQFHLVPYLTALENVMLAQYFHSITDEKEAAEALRRVGLEDRQGTSPKQLSGRRAATRGHRARADQSSENSFLPMSRLAISVNENRPLSCTCCAIYTPQGTRFSLLRTRRPSEISRTRRMNSNMGVLRGIRFR